jgi:hypothetical protein
MIGSSVCLVGGSPVFLGGFTQADEKQRFLSQRNFPQAPVLFRTVSKGLSSKGQHQPPSSEPRIAQKDGGLACLG